MRTRRSLRITRALVAALGLVAAAAAIPADAADQQPIVATAAVVADGPVDSGEVLRALELEADDLDAQTLAELFAFDLPIEGRVRARASARFRLMKTVPVARASQPMPGQRATSAARS